MTSTITSMSTTVSEDAISAFDLEDDEINLAREMLTEFTNSSGNESSTSGNRTSDQLPIDMQFNEGHQLAIAVYSLLFIVSAAGNLSVLVTIIKLRIKGRLTRINMFLLHLVIADLLVTFLMMPLEIVWNATVSWEGGDAMCRIMSFFRIFGLFLSGFILICISLDRYFAILKPLAIPEANSRGRVMLLMAWASSVVCSLPQVFIFHVERHPTFNWYEQCVTFNSFPSREFELAYNFFGFVFLYGVPLAMIVFCYSRILCEIFRLNALKRNENELRRSNMSALGRAKIRTLKMTVIIVATFFFCWTPYNVMSLWYWFDKNTAQEVDPMIQKGLFLFACTNSCVNPLIYGLFHFRKRQGFSSKNFQRSLVNGCPHRHPVPRSGAYKMRVCWRPNDCCTIGCRSSVNDSSDYKNASAKVPNHVHIRPTQQFWLPGAIGNINSCENSEQLTNRDITINSSRHQYFLPQPSGSRLVANGNVQHNRQRQSCNIQMTTFERYMTPQGSTDGNPSSKHAFIKDKSSKQTCVSSAL